MIKSSYGSLLAFVFFAGCLAGCNPSQSGGKVITKTRPETVWLSDYDAALKDAQSGNKLVVIDFFATWCGPCRMMERDTFPDEKIQQRLAGFVPLKVDVDKQPKLAAQYGITGMPTTLVVDATGKPIAGALGYLEVADYLAVLDKAKSGGSESKAIK
jgi:thiol:disulfide interchange protein